MGLSNDEVLERQEELLLEIEEVLKGIKYNSNRTEEK